MVTKEQALTETNFTKLVQVNGKNIVRKWRANGKCKTWKRNPERFQLPIKHGLYSYGYITEENAHLFEVAE